MIILFVILLHCIGSIIGRDEISVSTSLPIKSVECPVGYSHIHGHCYKYFQNAMRYWDASKTCENNGGYLVIITDETALTDVLDFAKDAKSWWIGLHIVKNKGSGKPTINDFRWSDGTKPNYTDWTYTFPRDITRYGSCVRMLGNTGGWENRHCLRYRLPFVCESPGIVVTPTTITPTISPSDVCPSEMYYLDGGEIYSPGYPLGYASHLTCVYELVCHIGETIKLEFEDLNLSGNSTITLRHMNGEQTVVDYVIDMNTAERKFNTTVSNVMYVEFRSGPAGGSWMFRWSKQTDESITCPPSYIGHNGYCYKFDRTPLTYSMATMACMRDNAFIASIGGVQENEYVNLLGGESDALWIGLKIGDQSVWADKSDSKYRNWMEGYPKPKTYYGSCVRMNIIKNGKWQNVPCEWIQLPFVCKKQGK
ncbi:hypothetical protein AB6A40_002010 [Gnathostoma spinigerum]|uniref:C-type lectin n=1 Tax=Gnathostoma spinigerum TaxID=75299 RepID=A0ABD6E804_9BILA